MFSYLLESSLFMMILTMIPKILIIIIIIYLILIIYSIISFYLFEYYKIIKNSCFYIGRVKHTRLKGGAVHALDYPLFFTCADLNEMDQLECKLWPIFSIKGNKKNFWFFNSFAFSLLDYNEHLKGWEINSDKKLYDRVLSFIQNETKNKNSSLAKDVNSINTTLLVTHLTYFGYCFNPVSFYFLYKNDDFKKNKEVTTIITEVSNTPWIEQHSYILHEDIEGLKINRNDRIFDATWNKEFHVSPFMEMDYKYNFIFSEPRESLNVKAKMIKLLTNEVWFTASFELKKIPFTPFNLLYVLVFYPLHTRIIQIWIHFEALKLWWKGVPTFPHPKGSSIDFGFGITDKLLLCVFDYIFATLDNLKKFIFKNKMD